MTLFLFSFVLSESVSLSLKSSRMASCSSTSTSAIAEDDLEGGFVIVGSDDDDMETNQDALMISMHFFVEYGMS